MSGASTAAGTTASPTACCPRPRAAEAAEWVTLAGGLRPVLERARAHLDHGNLQLACHLIEHAAAAAPSPEVHELRAQIYDARAAEQDSSMARGIFAFAAASSRQGKRDVFNPLTRVRTPQRLVAQHRPLSARRRAS